MQLRETGVGIIGDVPWGTHISYLYNTISDIFEIAIPYIKEGLLNNELCVWVYSDNTSYEEIRENMEYSILDIDKYISRGQLHILSYKDWYLENSVFCGENVLNKWIDMYKYAHDNGYDGLRAAGDTSWVDKCCFKKFSDYEQNINKIIPLYPFLVLCMYDMNRIDILEYTEIIKDHGLVVIKEYEEQKLLKNVELLVKTKQLEQSKEDYKNLIQLLPDAVFIFDEKAIFYCNNAASRFVGVKDICEIAGNSLLEFITDENKDAFSTFIAQVLYGKGGSYFLQTELQSKTGETIDVEAVAVRYSYNGLPAAISVIRDISHIKTIVELEKNIKESSELLNETLEYDKIKTEFFSNLSHEFRTPINVILSALQLVQEMKKDAVKDKEKSCLKIMKQNCYRLLRLVNNLIDITKMDSDFFNLKLCNCNIVEVVEDITLSVAEYIESKGITLRFDTNVEEKIIACDPEQIERVMLNLLSNAVKFTPAGGKIWVKLSDFVNKIVITVKDNGIGIPADKQKTIFNRFQQVNKSFNRLHEGSGIGLFLVKSLIEKHGGWIALKSKVGKGSEFTFEIPCNPVFVQQSDIPRCSVQNFRDFAERARIEFSDIYA